MEACPVFLKDFVTDETSEESDILSDNGEYLDWSSIHDWVLNLIDIHLKQFCGLYYIYNLK